MFVFFNTVIQFRIGRKDIPFLEKVGARPWQWSQFVPQRNRIASMDLILNRHGTDRKIRRVNTTDCQRGSIPAVLSCLFRLLLIRGTHARRHHHFAGDAIVVSPNHANLVGLFTADFNHDSHRVTFGDISRRGGWFDNGDVCPRSTFDRNPWQHRARKSTPKLHRRDQH